MKEVNIKDVEVTEETKKKINLKNIILWILIGIVTLVGIFFISTKIRWDADLEEHTEILYYGQENIKVDKITGYYGEKLDTEVDDKHAYLLYCDSEYGGDCLTADFNNGLDNNLRHPKDTLNIILLIDLVLVFMLISNRKYTKLQRWLIGGVVLVYGLINLGMVAYNFADYYYLVNDSEYLANANVVRGIVTENKEEFYPVVTYTIEDKEYIVYIDNAIKGTIEDNLNKQVTVYYDKNDNSLATTKRSLTSYILPLIISVLYIIFGLVFVSILKKKTKKLEESEE